MPQTGPLVTTRISAASSSRPPTLPNGLGVFLLIASLPFAIEGICRFFDWLNDRASR